MVSMGRASSPEEVGFYWELVEGNTEGYLVTLYDSNALIQFQDVAKGVNQAFFQANPDYQYTGNVGTYYKDTPLTKAIDPSGYTESGNTVEPYIPETPVNLSIEYLPETNELSFSWQGDQENNQFEVIQYDEMMMQTVGWATSVSAQNYKVSNQDPPGYYTYVIRAIYTYGANNPVYSEYSSPALVHITAKPVVNSFLLSQDPNSGRMRAEFDVTDANFITLLRRESGGNCFCTSRILAVP